MYMCVWVYVCIVLCVHMCTMKSGVTRAYTRLCASVSLLCVCCKTDSSVPLLSYNATGDAGQLPSPFFSSPPSSCSPPFSLSQREVS